MSLSDRPPGSEGHDTAQALRQGREHNNDARHRGFESWSLRLRRCQALTEYCTASLAEARASGPEERVGYVGEERSRNLRMIETTSIWEVAAP